MSGSEETKSVEDYLKKLRLKELETTISQLQYGYILPEISVPDSVRKISEDQEVQVKGYKISADEETLRPPRIIRVGLVQNSIVLKTDAPVVLQRQALYERIKMFIQMAAKMKVNVLCLQEGWTMPFAFCTREKRPWCEFAESAEDGPTTCFLKEECEKYNMVIVSSILERDSLRNDVIWNTSVVISNHGKVLGKHRKNHISRVGDFNESTYYMEGNTGNPVFKTEFGNIAVNICNGQHDRLNWLMFGFNGAEIVFNPSAREFGEPLWGMQARNAALANGYYTCAISRMGVETIPNEFTFGDGRAAYDFFGPFCGSNCVNAPNGVRTPGLSRVQEGLLVVELDLNLCRQVRDFLGFQMTQRLKAVMPDFKPQIIE